MLDEVVCDLEVGFAKHQEQSFRLSMLIASKIMSTNWEEVLPAVTKYSSLLKAAVSPVN
jgi:hypothetical protein